MFRALIEPRSFRTEGWSDVQLHAVQDFAIRRKSYCSRAAAGKSLLPTISASAVSQQVG